MARTMNKLSARAAATLKKPGRHADGGGLHLSISPDGSRWRWVFLFRSKAPGAIGSGKLRQMGLGSASTVTLAQSRELATRARAVQASGRSPLEERSAERKIPTFGEMADEVVASLEIGWRNPKHRGQWRMTLSTYCVPIRTLLVKMGLDSGVHEVSGAQRELTLRTTVIAANQCTIARVIRGYAGRGPKSLRSLAPFCYQPG